MPERAGERHISGSPLGGAVIMPTPDYYYVPYAKPNPELNGQNLLLIRTRCPMSPLQNLLSKFLGTVP